MRIKYIGIIFLFCVQTTACGYRFAGTGNLPAGVESIFIEVLENRTAETGIENTFTNELIYEFTRTTRKYWLPRIRPKHAFPALSNP